MCALLCVIDTSAINIRVLLDAGEATQNGNNVHGSHNGRPNTYDSVINQAVVPVSATARNISMVAAGARGNMQPQPWLQVNSLKSFFFCLIEFLSIILFYS